MGEVSGMGIAGMMTRGLYQSRICCTRLVVLESGAEPVSMTTLRCVGGN